MAVRPVHALPILLAALVALPSCSKHAPAKLDAAPATEEERTSRRAEIEYKSRELEDVEDDFTELLIAEPARQQVASTPAPRPEAEPAPARERTRHDVAKSRPAGDVGGLGTRAGNARPAAPPPPPTTTALVGDGNRYTDYGVNGFTLADEDALSTFAVDVDTASYTMARRTLTDGCLPSMASVRVEEFVNYLPFEYQQPAAGHPFAVDVEAVPTPWNSSSHLVRVGVQGKKVRADQRKSVHLTFLVDVSGSMSSADKIGYVKRSLRMLTEELSDGDTVAIATYAGATKVVLEPTPMSRKGEILRSLDRLTAGGSTAMSSGIDLAYGLADAAYVSGAVNRVIVCSDGDANVGRTSHQEMSQRSRGYAEKGVTLTTLGFGAGNYNDTLMERIANDGDGSYHYIDTMDEARRLFVDELTSSMEVIAKDVKIQVDWNPDAVHAYRLVGYENRDIADRDFRNDEVDAGEIGAGHQVTALFEVVLQDAPRGEVATVRVRNKAPGPDAPAVERAYRLDSDSFRSTFREGSADTRIAVASATFAEILRGSSYVSELSLGEVASMARDARRVEYEQDAELVRLIERAAELRGESAVAGR